MNNLLNNIIATSYGRRFGKTTAICKAAKEIGATVICANTQQAQILKLEHGIKTATIHQNLRGTTGPYLYDHFAMEQTVFELEHFYKKEIKDRDTRIINLINNVSNLEYSLIAYKALVKELDEKILKLKKKRKKNKNGTK